jgi:hypothetical protein
MRNRVTGWIITGLLCFVGCVPSLHELYTEDTVVYDPAILGHWQQDETTWAISGDPNAKSYTIVIVEQDDKRGTLESKLDGRLVELDGKRYLDIFPNKDVTLNVGNWFQAGLLRAHLFLKQDLKDGTLQLAAMNPETFKKLVEQKPDIVKHEETQDTIVLTASPKELQAFIKKYGATEKFFGDPMELKPKMIQNEPNELDDTATD